MMNRTLRAFAATKAVGLALATGLFIAGAGCAFAESARRLPEPEGEGEAAKPGNETAVLAGGCFWGVQGVFQHVAGVTSAVSGYAGGDEKSAHYTTVGRGDTGHAESVRITFDPAKISYGKILQIFLSVVHNPTELNRQGPDTGRQYRSAIFPQNVEQARIARAYLMQLDGAAVFPAPIATTIETAKSFYPAEAYHQDFLEKNPDHPYIVYNDLPKLAALKSLFPALYQEKPALVSPP
ncbi:MAG: peptide-methionine (S)-S-oxide reductase MsrA [Methylocystis sp.]